MHCQLSNLKEELNEAQGSFPEVPQLEGAELAWKFGSSNLFLCPRALSSHSTSGYCQRLLWEAAKSCRGEGQVSPRLMGDKAQLLPLLHVELCQRPSALSCRFHCQAPAPRSRPGPAHLRETPSQAPTSQGSHIGGHWGSGGAAARPMPSCQWWQLGELGLLTPR